MNIYSILLSKEHNSFYLTKYINFINKNIGKYSENLSNTEKHHILPKAKDMFPQYADFSENSWNKIILPLKKHFYAHYLLTMSYQWSVSQNESFCLMGGRLKNKNLLFLINEYHRGVNRRGKAQSIKMKGLVSARDIITGKNVLVTKEEFEKDVNLIGITKGKFIGDKNVSKRIEVRDKISNKKKGMINVIDKETNKLTQIKKENFDATNYQIKTGFSGRNNIVIILKDKSKLSINFDHPIYKTNNYISNNTRYLVMIKMNEKEFILNNFYSIKNFFDKIGENIIATNKMCCEYKKHKTGKFQYKKIPVSEFFT